MDIHAHRRKRLLELVAREADGNVAEYARQHNQDAARLRQVLNENYREGKSFGEGTAERLVKELGLPDLYFDLGIEQELTSKQDPHQSDAPITEDREALISRLLPQGKGTVITWENEADLPDDPERVWIDRFDYHFSAGTGVIQWEIREKKALPFDIGYFRALGSNPKDCRLLAVRGDSMEPYLFNRDMMMIDSTRTNVRDGRVYAVYFEDEPLVKQIFKQVGGGVVLHSYNSKYPDKEVPAERMDLVKIVGEVIHRSGSGLAGGN